jgi:hypothetical protein
VRHELALGVEGGGWAIRTEREAGYGHSIILVNSDDSAALMFAITILVEFILRVESDDRCEARSTGDMRTCLLCCWP